MASSWSNCFEKLSTESQKNDSKNLRKRFNDFQKQLNQLSLGCKGCDWKKGFNLSLINEKHIKRNDVQNWRDCIWIKSSKLYEFPLSWVYTFRADEITRMKQVRNNYDVNQGSQAAGQLVDFLVAILTRSFYNYLKNDRAVSSNNVHTSDFWDRSSSDFKNLERF